MPLPGDPTPSRASSKPPYARHSWYKLLPAYAHPTTHGMRYLVLTYRHMMYLPKRAMLSSFPVLTLRMVLSICLCSCYAISGTDLAYSGICLRSCYVMYGTDLGHGAICLCYACAM
eukprot:2588334-Rhodomonas_salina.2